MDDFALSVIFAGGEEWECWVCEFRNTPDRIACTGCGEPRDTDG